MTRFFKIHSIVFSSALALVVTACGQNANLTRHALPGVISNNEQKNPAPSPSPSPSESNAATHGFSFCEAALQQVPVVRQDSQTEGKNSLGFIHFSAEGKILVTKDATVEFSENNAFGDVQRVGYTVLPEQPQSASPGSAHSEQISFSHQHGKVKDVTIQRFQDGAWIRDKLTFLLSADESTCFVQHMHSDVEINNDPTSVAEFDLETCRLASDLENNPEEQAAVLKSGNLSSMKNCTSDFAQAALDQYYQKSASSPDSTYHLIPTVESGSPSNNDGPKLEKTLK